MKRIDAPLVSILTPSFNQGKWLGDNLQSVKSQTYPRIEHIIVDGGSKDQTVDLLRNSGPQVRWVSEKDNGQAHALNKAFERCNGEIVGWINSDDAYVDRRVVEKIVQIFESNPKVDLVYGDVILVNEQSEILEYYPMTWGFPLTRYMTSRKSMLSLGTPFMQPGVFFRKSAIEGSLTREEFQFSMDLELWLRLVKAGKQFRYAPFLVGIDRHQPERKGLDPAFSKYAARDRRELETTYGLVSGVWPKVINRAARSVQRLTGAVSIVRLDQSVDPAFGLLVDSRLYRLKRQLWTRRHQMNTIKGSTHPLVSRHSGTQPS